MCRIAGHCQDRRKNNDLMLQNSMFRKIVDVLKEVFWIKPSRKRRKPARRKTVKKILSRKRSSKKPPRQSPKLKLQTGRQTAIDPSLVQVGVITHYFDRIKVCVVKLTQGSVLIGDKLTILGTRPNLSKKSGPCKSKARTSRSPKKANSSALKWTR